MTEGHDDSFELPPGMRLQTMWTSIASVEAFINRVARGGAKGVLLRSDRACLEGLIRHIWLDGFEEGQTHGHTNFTRWSEEQKAKKP